MLRVYRKRKDSINAEWHFHTQCSRWPETDYIQTHYMLRENERLCAECAELEASMFDKPKV